MPQVMDLIEDAVRGSGRLCFLPSHEDMTFAQVWRQSTDIARWINARVGRGGAVGAVLSNTSACAASIFGVWRSGNTLVSLPYPSRGMSADRYREQILKMAKLTDIELLLIDSQYLGLVPELPISVVAAQETLAGGPRADTSGSGGLIQFTSGSVGTPKGVVLSAEAIGAHILSLIEVMAPAPGDVPCSWLPISHDMGLIGMFLTPIACLAPHILGRSTFALLTPEYFLSQPVAWLQTCSELGVTHTTAPNFALELACRTRDWAGVLDLSRLRALIVGAERVSAATLRHFAGAYADARFDPTALCPAYGMAEATLAVTMVRPAEPWQSALLERDALSAGRFVPATGAEAIEYVGNGSPMPGVEVRVAADPGLLGEIQVRGPSLLSSYVGADLVLAEDGWFATRDIGFLHEDELFLVGRTDDTVIVGGRNYYAPDIEAVVRHDAVRTGCLAAVPLEDGGFGLVAESRAELPAADLQRVCRELAVAAVRAAGIQPSIVAIVPRGRLPKTPSGKLQRVRIATQLRAGDLAVSASISIGGQR